MFNQSIHDINGKQQADIYQHRPYRDILQQKLYKLLENFSFSSGAPAGERYVCLLLVIKEIEKPFPKTHKRVTLLFVFFFYFYFYIYILSSHFPTYQTISLLSAYVLNAYTVSYTYIVSILYLLLRSTSSPVGLFSIRPHFSCARSVFISLVSLKRNILLIRWLCGIRP